MSPLMRKFLFSALALMFLFSACAPAQPTQSPDDIANQVATSVALTVAAQNAQTQAAQSAIPPATNTTLPTQTEAVVASPTPILPTATNTAVVLPTSSGGGGGGGGTTIKPEYACNAISRRPFDNEIFRPNDEFDVRWTIVNTGTKTMRAGLDLKFSNGTNLTSVSFVELPELDPGEEHVVVFDAVAPEKQGTYTMVFIVEGGLCYPATQIVVEK